MAHVISVQANLVMEQKAFSQIWPDLPTLEASKFFSETWGSREGMVTGHVL